MVNKAIEGRRVLAIHYYKENEDEFTKREIEPYRLANGPEGWYVASYDRRREDVRHFRLDRIKEAEISKERFEPRPEVEEIAAIEGTWLSGENVPAADVARVWVSPERARWASEEHTVTEELADDAVLIDVPYGSIDWLLREILKGAGDFVILRFFSENEEGDWESDGVGLLASIIPVREAIIALDREGWLTITLVALLLAPFFARRRNLASFLVALAGLTAALICLLWVNVPATTTAPLRGILQVHGPREPGIERMKHFKLPRQVARLDDIVPSADL